MQDEYANVPQGSITEPSPAIYDACRRSCFRLESLPLMSDQGRSVCAIAGSWDGPNKNFQSYILARMASPIASMVSDIGKWAEPCSRTWISLGACFVQWLTGDFHSSMSNKYCIPMWVSALIALDKCLVAWIRPSIRMMKSLNWEILGVATGEQV